MSEDLSKLPPEIQQMLVRFQQLQQTLQSVLAQKQQVELESTEISQATEELQKLPDDAVIYKATGSLMIKAEKAKVMTDLAERKELLTSRVSILTRQEERLRAQLKETQTKLQEHFGQPATPSPQP